MKAVERPSFEQLPDERVYDVVERHGAIEPDDARRAAGLDHRAFVDALTRLIRAGHVEETGGNLRLSIDAGDDWSYVQDGVGYTIRPARQEDLEGIVKVMRRIVDERAYVGAESVAEQLLHDGAVLRRNEATSRVFFVAVSDNHVVGWTHVDTSSLAKLRHVARQTIGVLEPYRGYRIGGRLMERGLAWAADNGFQKLYNGVPATNEDAIAFLSAYGAEVEAVRRGHYRIGGEFVDEVQMAIYPADVLDDVDEPADAMPRGGGRRDRLSNVDEHLRAALDAGDPGDREFHARQALQHLEFAREDADRVER